MNDISQGTILSMSLTGIKDTEKATHIFYVYNNNNIAHIIISQPLI
jgi:hypothetical protein